MPASSFLWSTGDVPSGYEAITISWAEGKTMRDAAEDLRKNANKNGADGIVAVRFTPITTIEIQTKRGGYSADGGGDISGSSTTRWAVYGTLVKRK
jgi:uncharacterized protein YbjQ (UPF0145 family)